jgi:hypothetical protein
LLNQVNKSTSPRAKPSRAEPSKIFLRSSLVEPSSYYLARSDRRAELENFGSSLMSESKGLLARLLVMLGSLVPLARPARLVAIPGEDERGCQWNEMK